jgi:ParB family chromosome partitioning protein
MKKPFNLLAITADLPRLPEETDTKAAAAKPRFPAVPIAKAIETQHRNAMAELKELEASIAQQRNAGLLVEEIDPSLVDPSPYWDRDSRFVNDHSFTEFVEDIRRNGQQSPALIRRHPTVDGRFEVCFGHRRLFACRALGMRLRAIVRDLSEAQMAGAAFSENTHRESVSTLEQARALARYIDRGVFPTKQALADALGVSRAHVSNLTSYAEIPDVVLQALGDWRKCTFRDAGNLLKVSRDATRKAQLLQVADQLIRDESNLGFGARLAQLLGQRVDGAEDAIDRLYDSQGRLVATCKRGVRATTITLDAMSQSALGEFVWGKLPLLMEEFQRRTNTAK